MWEADILRHYCRLWSNGVWTVIKSTSNDPCSTLQCFGWPEFQRPSGFTYTTYVCSAKVWITDEGDISTGDNFTVLFRGPISRFSTWMVHLKYNLAASQRTLPVTRIGQQLDCRWGATSNVTWTFLLFLKEIELPRFVSHVYWSQWLLMVRNRKYVQCRGSFPWMFVRLVFRMLNTFILTC